jgi:hypothetical protein
LSYLKVKLVGEFVFPAASVPVTASVAALVVLATQLIGLETNGPPAGLVTVEPVNVQPLVEPPSGANVLEAPPEVSVSAFCTLKLPPVPYAYQTVLPDRKDAGLLLDAGPACVLWLTSERTFVGGVLSIETLLLSLPVLPAVSPWLACALYVPSAVTGANVPDVQVPLVQVALPERLSKLQLTLALSAELVELSATVPQVPLIEVTFAFVEYGNVRVVPFTCVTATTGAVLSILIGPKLALVVFETLSVAVPLVEAVVPSLLNTWSALQPARPEPESLHA